MKKIAIVFSALILILSSCSSDDEDSVINVSNNKIIKYTLIENNNLITFNFIYNGDKIVRVVSDNGFRGEYTYTGDYITKYEDFFKDLIRYKVEYQYENSKNTQSLKTIFGINGVVQQKRKTVFTHLANGDVDFTNYTINISTNDELEGQAGTYIYSNGNLISRHYNDGSSNKTYSYDDKYNPVINILNWNKIIENESSASTNNLLISTEVASSPLMSVTIVQTHSYTYNERSYPLTDYITETGSGSSPSNIKFFYE